MKRFVVLLTVLCLAFCAMHINIFAAPAEGYESVNIIMSFDKETYTPGETAVLTVSLTGIAEEADAGLKLGAFETHLKYDNSQLIYIKEESSFVPALNLQSSDISEIADKDFGFLAVMFNKLDGVALSGDKLDIATLKFTVEGSLVPGDTVSVHFDDISLGAETSDFASVVIPTGVHAADAWDYVIPEGTETASVTGIEFTAGAPEYDELYQKITVPVTVRKAADSRGLVLVVAAYKKGTNMLAAPAYIDSVSIGADDTEIFLTGENAPVIRYIPAGEYDIRCYLWESLINMKAVTEAVTMEYTAESTGIPKATIIPGNPTYDSGTRSITAPVTVSKVANGKKLTLVVALYNKGTEVLAAPSYIDSVSIGGDDINVVLTGDNAPGFANIPAGEYEIRYYLWENFDTIRSEAASVSRDFSAN